MATQTLTLKEIATLKDALEQTKSVGLWHHPRVTYARDKTLTNLEDTVSTFRENRTNKQEEYARTDAKGDVVYELPSGQYAVMGDNTLEEPADNEGEERTPVFDQSDSDEKQREKAILENGALIYDVPEDEQEDLNDALHELEETEERIQIHKVSRALALDESNLDTEVLNQVDFGAIDSLFRATEPSVEKLIQKLSEADRSMIEEVVEYVDQLLNKSD